MEKFLTVCAALILTAGMWSAEPETRKIALTFDDGPHPVYTEEILKVLEQEQVPATFFLLGENAEQYREQVRMIAEQGHLIGNHTWRHVQVTSLPKEEYNLFTICVVKLISGTNIIAVFPLYKTFLIKSIYTIVFPLPVIPYKRYMSDLSNITLSTTAC